MHLYCTQCEQGTLLAAFNVIHDRADRVVLRLPPNTIKLDTLQSLEPDGSWRPASAHLEDLGPTERLVVSQPLAPLDGLFLLQRR